MDFNPSALAMVAFAILLAGMLYEGYLTCRHRRRALQERRIATGRPRLVRRRFSDANDQAPYGTSTSLGE